MNTLPPPADTPRDPAHDTRLHWEQAAAGWTAHAPRIARMTAEASEALLDAFAPRAGECLLDVACGSGDPALRLARAVGATGCVVALDGVARMVEVIAQRSAEDALRQPHVLNARAEALPFAADTFDGLCCRFGLMFFDDRTAALRDARRVLKPGGRIVHVVWSDEESNPYFRVAADALDSLGAPALDLPPGAPTVFDCADPDRLSELFGSAGFVDVAVASRPLHMQLPDTRPEELLDVQRSISPSLGERTASLDEATLDHAREKVGLAVCRWERDGGLAIPGECLLVRGEVPPGWTP